MWKLNRTLKLSEKTVGMQKDVILTNLNTASAESAYEGPPSAMSVTPYLRHWSQCFLNIYYIGGPLPKRSINVRIPRENKPITDNTVNINRRILNDNPKYSSLIAVISIGI